MIRGFALADRGAVKQVNDDMVVMGRAAISAGACGLSADAPLLAAVLDGVSQGGRGAEASNLVAAHLVDYAATLVGQDAGQGSSPADDLVSVFEQAQVEIGDYVAGLERGAFAATTVSGILILSDRTVIGFNAGDSRVYRLRADTLVQMTVDHVPGKRMASGQSALDQAELDAHVITRAVGLQGAASKVDVEDFGKIMPGDLFLGCTDGLCGYVDRDAMKQALSQGAPLDVVAQSLRDMALHNGSRDNISLFLLVAE